MQVKILTAPGLGIVVDGRCDSRFHLFLPPICNVSSSADFPIPILSKEKLSPAYHLHNSMYFHKTELSMMTATWLLPIVAPIVAAASGGIVAAVLPNSTHALWTVIVSYILWGTGIPLAMAVLVIYFQRLAVHKLPAREVIVSVFLPLGPLGQGGFAIMQLGKVALTVFPETHTLDVGAGTAGEI